VKFGDEALLLALLNTAPTVGSEQRDELGTRAAGLAWLAEHGAVADEATLVALREVREDLWAVVRGEESGTLLGRHLDGVQAVPSAGPRGVEWRLQSPPERRAAALALLAWSDLEATSPGRVRPCGNPECTLFLIDRSKSNSARWCSMAVCGNRMKARRHQQRLRS
jgi:predicted RNA-binding Zn ribbon-like protein